MNALLKKLLDRMIVSGWLAVATNLLYEAVLAGWIAFAGLYGIEALLPTFVTARLSLVKFAIVLLALSGLLAWLGQRLKGADVPAAEKKYSRLLLTCIILVVLGIITITHYRFPWWSIPLSVCGYVLVFGLFWRDFRSSKR